MPLCIINYMDVLQFIKKEGIVKTSTIHKYILDKYNIDSPVTRSAAITRLVKKNYVQRFKHNKTVYIKFLTDEEPAIDIDAMNQFLASRDY